MRRLPNLGGSHPQVRPWSTRGTQCPLHRKISVVPDCKTPPHIVSGCPANKPRQVPEDDVSEASSSFINRVENSAAPHSSVEREFSRLEFERPLSVLLATQIERDQRIAQLTDELVLKSALLEEAEANAAEATKRAGLHADRLLIQTSLVERRDAELVDMRTRLDEL